METLQRGRARPALFRALGSSDPPTSITLDGEEFALSEILKHDSWAATALYARKGKKVVCKFNRRQSILGLPMAWLGRTLARREAEHYRRLADLANVPNLCGPVVVEGHVLPNAVAHAYVEGHPLGEHEKVADQFFPTLTKLLEKIHRRGMAYVDLHKRENIIVGADGKPYLIDFQVSFVLGDRWRWLPFSDFLLGQLQAADRYHLLKHQVRHRPDLFGDPALEDAERPLWIRLHRLVAVPLRGLRRKLLVLLGIRKSAGRASSEHFAEDAVRQEVPLKKSA